MSPPMPPLPVPMYLPFQPEYGIQTSILMFESDVGVKVAATRQNAGKLSKTGPPGTANFPVRTNWAVVIAVSGSLKVVRLAHVAATAGAASIPRSKKNSPASTLTTAHLPLDTHLMVVLPVGYSSGIPASRRPAKYVASNRARIVGTPHPEHTVNDPAGTCCASVISVSGKLSAVRLSQGAASASCA